MLPCRAEEKATKKRSVASMENRGCAGNTGHGWEEKHGRWDTERTSTVSQRNI